MGVELKLFNHFDEKHRKDIRLFDKMVNNPNAFPLGATRIFANFDCN